MFIDTTHRVCFPLTRLIIRHHATQKFRQRNCLLATQTSAGTFKTVCFAEFFKVKIIAGISGTCGEVAIGSTKKFGRLRKRLDIVLWWDEIVGIIFTPRTTTSYGLGGAIL